MKSKLRRGCLALVLTLPLGFGSAAWADGDRATDVLWVEGMTLQDCDEVGLELLLESLPGVEEVLIEFASGRTEVSYDPGQLGREELIAEVHNRGFEVPRVTDTFLVHWNDARRDAPAVRLLLGSLDGVSEVEVEGTTARTIVQYDPSRVQREDLVAEIGNLGWELEHLPIPSPESAR